MESNIVTLAEISIGNTGSYGIAASAVEFSTELPTYLRITDINDDGTLNKSGLKSVNDKRSDKYRLKPNDIVFARTGASTGRNYFYDGKDGEFVYAGFLIKFSINPHKAFPKYIKYVCLSQEYRDWVKAQMTGSTRGNMNAQQFAKLPINLPPLITQRKIASILSAIDDKIELNNRMNENLEEQAKSLYEEVFLKNSNGVIRTLDEFCEIFTGKKNANASVATGKYAFFTCSPDVLNIDSFIYNGNAIIVSGNGAYTGRTRFYSGPFDLYQRTYACTIKENINPNYIYTLYWFVKFSLSKKIGGGTRGSAIPYIVMNDLAKYEFIFNETVFNEYSLVFQKLCNKQISIEKENKCLAELRDTLLPKLMSGEIDVDAIEL